MKKIKAIIFCIIILSGCGTQNEKTKSPVKISGTYSGIVPCADCEGINYQLTFGPDSSFTEKMVYIGKSVEPVEAKGTWRFKDSNVIVLNWQNGGSEQLEYSDGKMFMLDASGKKMEGPLADKFILKPGETKNPVTQTNTNTSVSPNSINGKWILMEIDGQKADSSSYTNGLPFLEIREADNKFTGSTGCNRINGASTINGNYLTFSKYNKTRMACPGDGESNFINALSKIDSYKIEGNNLMMISDGKSVLVFSR